jgi:altronate hydrolase
VYIDINLLLIKRLGITLAQRTYLKLHPADDVILALQPLQPGEVIEDVVIRDHIPLGHKMALRAIATDAPIHKYATRIAVATTDIQAGQHVHVHNAAMPAAVETLKSTAKANGHAALPAPTQTHFDGIRRNDGRIATRNYLGILTTVNCSATVARAVADHYRGSALDRWPGVDGVIALTHGSGCAMSSNSEGIATLRRTLAGYARHPNFAGILVIGLGCESNELGALMTEIGDLPNRVSFDIQSQGGTRNSIERGIEALIPLLDSATGVVREPVPISALRLGLQCGGSDAFSGISANPALGYASDLLVAAGGSVILSETPEIYGAEHLLYARSRDHHVVDDLKARIDWWRDHVAVNGGTLNDNPSSGNIAGGITTILEKSLGAVAKCGTSPLNGIYAYAEPIVLSGLVFMDSPGFDPMSATGQVASGANLIAFTTGRGSTFGCKPVPSLKISTNSGLYERMREDMDVNCGEIVDGNASVAEKGQEIYDALIAMASGKQSASELLGFGEAEFTPWVPGAIT